MLLVGLLITLSANSSNNSTSEVTVDALITKSSGTYRVYGNYESDFKSGKTLISDKNYTVTGWDCYNCDGYGVALVEKRGRDYTIKEFEKKEKLVVEAVVLKRVNNRALLLVNNRTFWVEAVVENKSNKAYLINETWYIR